MRRLGRCPAPHGGDRSLLAFSTSPASLSYFDGRTPMTVQGCPPVAWRRRRGLPRARRARPISASMSSSDDPGRSIASRFTRTPTLLDSPRLGVRPLKSQGAGRSMPEVPILAAPQCGYRPDGLSYQRLPGASTIKMSESTCLLGVEVTPPWHGADGSPPELKVTRPSAEARPIGLLPSLGGERRTTPSTHAADPWRPR
jgi:hypothetical protein